MGRDRDKQVASLIRITGEEPILVEILEEVLIGVDIQVYINLKVLLH